MHLRFSLLAVVALLAFPACASVPKLSPTDRLQQAEHALQGWKTRWAPSGKAAEGEDEDAAKSARHQLFALRDEEALVDNERLSFAIAEAEFACGDYKAAYDEYRDLLENFPLTEKRPDAERAIFQIAVLWSQRDSSFLGLGLFSDRDRAIVALTYLVDYAPRSPFADDSLRLMGIISLQDHDYEGAITNFERILQGYPESIWADFAEFHIGLSYLRRVRSPRVDRDGLLQAETHFKDYLNRRAEGAFRTQAIANLAETTEKLAESEYGIGAFYLRIRQPYGARYHWKETVRKYPGTRSATLASEELAKLPPEPATATNAPAPPEVKP